MTTARKTVESEGQLCIVAGSKDKLKSDQWLTKSSIRDCTHGCHTNGSIYNCELSLSLNAKTIFLLVDPGLAWELDREMLGMMIPRGLEKLI